jgi:hypothetical protein
MVHEATILKGFPISARKLSRLMDESSGLIPPSSQLSKTQSWLSLQK